MRQYNRLPRWGQWASGLALMAVALTAGGLSLAMNITAGLQLSIMLAIAFGLSDIGKILLPIVCQAVGWSKHLRIAYIVASAVSVLCAVFYLADQFGADIASKENAGIITANADQHITDLRTSLTSLRTMATSEAQRGGCGPKCQSLQDQAGQLEGQLSDAIAKRETIKPEMVDGKASVFAGVLGTNERETSRGMAVTLIFASLLVMELFAHAAGAAAKMIGQAMKAKPKAKTPAKPKATPRKKPAAKKPAKTDWSKIDAYGIEPAKRKRKNVKLQAINDNV